MKLKVKKLHPDAKLPTRAHHDDAGLDIYCYEDVILAPRETKNIPTGVAIEIPDGFVLLAWDKSSLGTKGIKTLGVSLIPAIAGKYSSRFITFMMSRISFRKGTSLPKSSFKK